MSSFQPAVIASSTRPLLSHPSGTFWFQADTHSSVGLSWSVLHGSNRKHNITCFSRLECAKRDGGQGWMEVHSHDFHTGPANLYLNLTTSFCAWTQMESNVQFSCQHMMIKCLCIIKRIKGKAWMSKSTLAVRTRQHNEQQYLRICTESEGKVARSLPLPLAPYLPQPSFNWEPRAVNHFHCQSHESSDQFSSLIQTTLC